MTAEEIIQKLELTKSPTEGGYYRELHQVKATEGDERPRATDIYYLLESHEICTLHKVKVPTEIYSYLLGSPIEMLQIDSGGRLEKIILGPDVHLGHRPRVVVPPHTWQGLRILNERSWTLLGITCVPGFRADDYVGITRAEFASMFPHLGDVGDRFIEH